MKRLGPAAILVFTIAAVLTSLAGATQYVSDGSITLFDLIATPGSTLAVEFDCGDNPAVSASLVVLALREPTQLAQGTADLATGSGSVVVPIDLVPGSYRVQVQCIRDDGSIDAIGAQFQVITATVAPTSATPAFTG